MEAILYAEVYFICIIFALLLFVWTVRSSTRSTQELWLKRTLLSFLLNFVSNFLFTIFNRVWVIEGAVIPLSYTFKTLYFMTMVVGVYCYCGYAEASLSSGIFEDAKKRPLLYTLLGTGLIMPLINLFTGRMFDFGLNNEYQRHFLFRIELIYLFLCSLMSSLRLLKQASNEAAPAQKAHLRLTASFPLCILASLILSYVGEAVPVICVSITVEMLCIYMGTTRHQISMDMLTQVNNRQNLLGFMDYKLKNHSGDLLLLMIDVDRFKQINDTYGHLAGDKALIEVSYSLKRACGSIQKRPYIARYGGDEFIIVMEGTEADAEKLCADIRGYLNEINQKSDAYKLTLSIGIARYEEGMDHKALIAAADEQLYRNKRKAHTDAKRG